MGSEQTNWFATTHWTVVLGAGENSSPAANAALEELCRCYWFPLYTYVRRRGHDAATAEDLVQGFFERFLRKNYLGGVDRKKGKFRSFLLAAMNHYLSNEADRARAEKRGGKIEFVHLDGELPEERFARETIRDESPDNAYERRWAVTLLQQAMSRLEREQALFGKGREFERLKVFLADRPKDGDYERAALELNLTQSAITSLVHRLRERYRELVRFEVAQTVSAPSEIDEEMQHLLRVFAR